MAAEASIQLEYPRRRASIAWALLVIAHLLGAPLACVWHCQAGPAMAGMSHGSHQHAAPAATPANHAAHQAARAARPTHAPGAAAPDGATRASFQLAVAAPCDPHGAAGEAHPTAIFPATLAPATGPALSRQGTTLAPWAGHGHSWPRRPVIPPPRS